MIQRTLQLIFATAAGGTTTISISSPRADLTSTEVEAVMQQIIAANVFTSTGGDLVDVVGARVITRETTELLSA